MCEKAYGENNPQYQKDEAEMDLMFTLLQNVIANSSII